MLNQVNLNCVKTNWYCLAFIVWLVWGLKIHPKIALLKLFVHNFFVPKISLSQKFICRTQKDFGTKKMFGSKKFWVKKNSELKMIASKTILVLNKFWVKKYICVKKFRNNKFCGLIKQDQCFLHKYSLDPVVGGDGAKSFSCQTQLRFCYFVLWLRWGFDNVY